VWEINPCPPVFFYALPHAATVAQAEGLADNDDFLFAHQSDMVEERSFDFLFLAI